MLHLRPLPAFSDNYIWLLTEDAGSAATAVDPGAAAPVLDALQAAHLSLTAILITHHHQDHIGGLDALLEAFPGVRIYGPDDRRIPALTDRLDADDTFRPAGLRTSFRVLDVPGHTATHIAYLTDNAGTGCLFCGDTLFAAGCGRVFDGTCEQLAGSLERIAALPGETLCYCAHEYTLANLGFAHWVEPDNLALAARLHAEQARRAAGQPTVPFRLDQELATNPFLRTDNPGVIAAAENFAGQRLATRAAVFAALRRWKDERYD